MTSSGRVDFGARLFGVSLDEFGDAIDECMCEPFLDRLVSPSEILFRLLRALAFEPLGQRQQPFRAIGTAVEDNVLAGFAQLGIDVFIDLKLTGIDDAHVHAGCDRMIEKHRMHGLANTLVTAEREG